MNLYSAIAPDSPAVHLCAAAVAALDAPRDAYALFRRSGHGRGSSLPQALPEPFGPHRETVEIRQAVETASRPVHRRTSR